MFRLLQGASRISRPLMTGHFPRRALSLSFWGSKDIIAAKDKLIADKEKELERVLADKEKELQRILADKELILAEKSTNNHLLEKELARTKQDSLAQFAKVCGVLNMRYLVEIGMSSYASKDNLGNLSTTAALKKFSEKIVVQVTEKGNTRYDLSEDAKGWLQKLEPGRDKSSVIKELSLLFHQLSKVAHNTIVLGNTTGIYCAGEFPLRAAVGLVVLALQKGGYLDPSFNKIKYGGQDYEARFLLQSGTIVDVPQPISSTTSDSVYSSKE